ELEPELAEAEPESGTPEVSEDAGAEDGAGDRTDEAGAEVAADAAAEAGTVATSDAGPDADADTAEPEAEPAEAGADEAAADADDGEGARTGEVAAEAVQPAAPPTPKTVMKPLVSDLPPERPEGGADGRGTGPVGFGTPGRPVQARTSPYAPLRPTPLPSAIPPHTKPRTAPDKDAGKTGSRDGSKGGTKGGEKSGAAVGAGPLPAAEGAVVGPEGTRGMPVPPAPDAPLKLLAELTNTPPPRQTLWRSALRRFKIWTPLVVLLALVYFVVQAVRPLPSPELDLTAAATYTFDGTSLPQSMPWPTEGQSVAEVEGLGSLGVHGAQTPVPIASVTKVMTAYVILQDHPLSGKQNGPTITVDTQAANEASSPDESTVPVKAGARYTERQMLQLLLIPSGNNIARLLARWDAGTQEAFVQKMTKAATALGMTNTTYTGASGFEETTVSTAADQLKLEKAVMKNDVFRSVVAIPNIDIPGVGRIFNNNNDLVNYGVIGVKTGSSTPAGGALMWAATTTLNGKQQLILGVVLQQHAGTLVSDSLNAALQRSQAMITAVQKGLTSATIVKKGEVVGQVDDGMGGTTPVVASKDLTAIGWPGMKADVTLTADSSGVPHNAKAGTQVGTISLGTGSARTTVPVQLQTDQTEPSFAKKLVRVS
ncbi:MAG: hypothetical protein QOF98_607, partial [Streptomyces sp.]|nr:hypothetical protein [Streptomyces sp.]